MLNRRTLFLLILCLALMTGATFAQGGSISLGDTVTATADDEQVDYVLSLNADETVFIDLSSDEFDTYIEVLDEDGATVAFNDDGGDGFNSYLEFTAVAAGDYTLRVRAFVGNANGEFTLSVSGERNGNSGNSGSGSIAVGDTITETSSSRVEYTLSLEEGDVVQIAVTSPDFDTYLELLDDSGDEVASDDDSGEGLNSQIDYTASASGLYTIVVRSFGSDNADGTYTLSVSSGGRSSGNGSGGNVGEITGQINVGDTITETSNSRVAYAIDLEEGDVVQISVTSPDFDTYLELYDESGTQLVTDDDGGEGLNSLLTYTVADSGTYTIRVRSFGTDEAGGTFTLSVDATEVILELAGGELSYGDTVTIEPEGAITTIFSFSGSEGDIVNIIVNSSTGEDSRLYLYDQSGDLVAEDDDSGEGTNPLLTRLSLPSSGTYTLEVQGFGERAMTTSFTVTLEQTQLLLLNEGMQSLTLGDDIESDAVALDVEEGSQWVITISASQDSDSTVYIDLREPSESYAATRISFSSIEVVSFVYRAESDGRVQIGFEYYAYDGATTFEITAEPLEGQADK